MHNHCTLRHSTLTTLPVPATPGVQTRLLIVNNAVLPAAAELDKPQGGPALLDQPGQALHQALTDTDRP